MPRPAIFFDRDGCLILDKNYLYKPELIEYFPDAFAALKQIQDLGYMLFIVTNQSGIGRGMFKSIDMELVHKKIQNDMSKRGIRITEIVHCPHTPEDNCQCRKPSPYLVEKLIQKYDIDKKNSYFIGDKISDAMTGTNAGINGVLIFTSHSNCTSFKNLTAFADSLKKLP